MKIFYFTSTGNSLYVARKIGCDLFSIPQCLKEKNVTYEDDVIGFVFPCYGLNVPKIVRRFIKENTFKTNYMFAIMTCGNMAGAAFELMEEECDIKLNYHNHVLMVDDYISNYTGVNNACYRDDTIIDKEINLIINDINNKTENEIIFDLRTKELSRHVESSMMKDKVGEYDATFTVIDDCIKCKTCEKVCPVGNITVIDKPEFAHLCQGCLSCMHHCPQNAIRPKDDRGKLRYMNKFVTLNDIITSNNQK